MVFKNVSNISSYDLFYIYTYMFNPQGFLKHNKEYRINTFENINYLLDNGWCSENIIKQMYDDYNKEKTTDLVTLKKQKQLEQSKNLLDSKKTYFHNLLCIKTILPKLELDLMSGKIKTQKSIFFREQIASINITQIVEYYIKHKNLSCTVQNPAMAESAIKYIVSKSKDIDLLLFCIDIADDLFYTNDVPIVTKPFDILKFADKAKEDICSKKTMLVKHLNIDQDNINDRKYYTIRKKRDKGDKWMNLVKSIVAI